MPRQGFKRPVRAVLPAATFGTPRCPCCGTGVSGSDGNKPYVVTISDAGVELRPKGARKERFFIDWHDIRDVAIRKGFALGTLHVTPAGKRKPRVDLTGGTEAGG